MTKADLISAIASKTGVERKDVLQVVESLMETIKESMVSGENIYLRGFGTFVVRERAEKAARNISKNTTIIIPRRRVPTFKPSKLFTSMFENK